MCLLKIYKSKILIFQIRLGTYVAASMLSLNCIKGYNMLSMLSLRELKYTAFISKHCILALVSYFIRLIQKIYLITLCNYNITNKQARLIYGIVYYQHHYIFYFGAYGKNLKCDKPGQNLWENN